MTRRRGDSRVAEDLRRTLAERLASGAETISGLARDLGAPRHKLQRFASGADSQISFVEALARRLGRPLRLGR